MGISHFVERTVRRVATSPVDFRLLHPDAIAGNLVSGAAGVAFFLYEAGRLRDDERLFERAAAWAAAGRSWADRATTRQWIWSTNGFLNGAGGLAFVEALLAARAGDTRRAARAITAIGEPSRFREGTCPTELYGGDAGALVAALNLEARIGNSPALAALRAKTTKAVSARSKNLLLGVAHGQAGEIWAQALAGGVTPHVRKRLDALWAIRKTDVNGLVYWLPTAASDDKDLLDTWCHGMTGHSLLWTSIARRAPTKRLVAIAKKTTETAALFSTPHPSVCCGLAGRSVALQQYADLSGDPRFARRAYTLLERATREIERPVWSKVQHGLWQGALGIALVAMQRLAGEHTMPCIEPLSGG